MLEAIAAGRMPFHETGTQELLERVLAGGRLQLTAAQDAARGRPHRAHARHAGLTSTSRSTSRRSAASLDDLLPLLREGHSLILRSTVAPGTTDWVAGYVEQRRGFRVGEDLFVAHVPERIAENHFLEEIATLPRIVGGVGAGSGDAAAELFEVFGTEIVQTTPVQAELAKIWTNILRYANFALPNLLMMNCEQYGANVFEVIDLINHDYPRGGIARPGPDRRHLPAQGLRLLRGALERARHAAGGLARERDRAAVPRRGAQAPARRSLRDRKVAVLGLTFKRNSDDLRDSLSLKLIRLLERELAARRAPRPARARRVRAARGRARRAPTPWSSPPTTREFEGLARPRSPRRRAARGPVERHRRRAGVRLRAARAELRGRRPMSRVLVTGGAGTIGAAVVRRLLRDGAWEVRVSDQRPAPAWMREACEIHTGDLRELDEARAAIAGCTHVDPPGRDRRRHRATSTSCRTRCSR